MAMIKTDKEIKEISLMADLISELITKSLGWVVPGITTLELDRKICSNKPVDSLINVTQERYNY